MSVPDDVASGSLTAASAARLRRQLATLAHNRIFPVLVETALYAIFTALILASVYIFWKRGLRHSWTNCVMLAAAVAMYALSTIDWAIDLRLLWNDLRTLMVYGLPVPHTVFEASSPPLLVVQGITSVVCIIIGDAVVCWRVCVVWGSNRRVVAAAFFWVIGSIGVFTAFSVMFVGFYYPVPPAVQTLVDHNVIVNDLSFSWSAATNIWATTMIGYKAWLQRQDLGRHMRSSSSTTVQKVLMLLVDLGVIYTIFMLLNVIVLIPSLNGGTFFYYVTMFMQQITGMYPTAIIVLVALQKSHLDHRFTYPPSRDEQSLPFTVNVHHPTFASDVSASSGFDKEKDKAKRASGGLQLAALRERSASTSGFGLDRSFGSSTGTAWEKETSPTESVGLAR